VGFSGIDLLVHITIFGLWATAAMWESGRPWTVWLWGLALAIATETIQILIPGRGFSWWDLVFDALGVALGIALGRYARRTFAGREPSTPRR